MRATIIILLSDYLSKIASYLKVHVTEVSACIYDQLFHPVLSVKMSLNSRATSEIKKLKHICKRLE